MTVGWQATIAIATWISVLIQLTYATAKATTLSCDANVDRKKFQYTLPRRQRRVIVKKVFWRNISIYATAKAATWNMDGRSGVTYISIYATAKAATENNFDGYEVFMISIYATAKAATLPKKEL